MIRCNEFSVHSNHGQTVISYTYDVLDPETGEAISLGKAQTMIPMDEDVTNSIETIRRFLIENGDITEESLKPRRY